MTKPDGIPLPYRSKFECLELLSHMVWKDIHVRLYIMFVGPPLLLDISHENYYGCGIKIHVDCQMFSTSEWVLTTELNVIALLEDLRRVFRSEVKLFINQSLNHGQCSTGQINKMLLTWWRPVEWTFIRKLDWQHLECPSVSLMIMALIESKG